MPIFGRDSLVAQPRVLMLPFEGIHASFFHKKWNQQDHRMHAEWSRLENENVSGSYTTNITSCGIELAVKINCKVDLVLLIIISYPCRS
jgi:hypothetical protein